MVHRAARQFSLLAVVALSVFLAGNLGRDTARAATPPPLNLQPLLSAVSCKAPDVVVYVDNYQNLKIYYTSDQAAFTAKPDQSAGPSVTGFTCLSIAKANGFTQGANVIPIKGPNGVTFNLYPTAADAQKLAPAGCRSAANSTLPGDVIVYVNQGRAYRLDDPQVGKGLNAYTCWSEALKGGVKLNLTLYKQDKDVPACPNQVVYVDNAPGETGYYRAYQGGFRTKPGTGGYLCQKEAEEIGYPHLHEFYPSASSLTCDSTSGRPVWADKAGSEYYWQQQPGFKSHPGSGGYTCQYDAIELSYKLHVETLASASKNLSDVKCNPPDQAIFIDGVQLTYGPLELIKAVNAPGYVASMNELFACLGDAKSHGFHVTTLLMPPDTSEKRLTQVCGTDGAWFTPSGHPTVYMRSTNPHYAEGDGAYSCGRWATAFLGARPATPDDAKIPPPFSCNSVSINDTSPARLLVVNYAAGGCSYDLDKTTIDPSPIAACGTPPNAFTLTTNGRKDVLRFSLMLNGGVLFRGWGYGSKRQVRQQLTLPGGNQAVLCLLGQKMAGQ